MLSFVIMFMRQPESEILQEVFLEEKMQEKLSKTSMVILLAMFCCFLWGSAFPCIKIGYKMFEIAGRDVAAQILFAGIRFSLAGMMVIIVFSIINHQVLKPSNPDKIIVLSIFQTILQYVPFYIGLAHTTGVKSSIITGSGTFLTILVSCLIFKQEKLTGKKLFGSILGFAGVIIVNVVGVSVDFHLSFMGEGFILIAALSSAFSSAFIKQFSKTADVVMLSGYQFFTGGIVMVVIGAGMGGSLHIASWQSVLLLFYMGFISAAAYTVWSILLKYNNVSKVSACKFMNPVFGVLLSFAFLHESSQMGIQTFVALLLVCAGIYIVNAGEQSIQRKGFKKR